MSEAQFEGVSIHPPTTRQSITGIRMTGIFPLDRRAVRPSEGQVKPKLKSLLGEQTGLMYVPLFSAGPMTHQSQAVTPSFSETEIAQFEIHFEEEYDLDIHLPVISVSTPSLTRQLSCHCYHHRNHYLLTLKIF